MPNESMSFADETLSETAGQVTDKVSEFGRRAAGKIDEKREATASGLAKAASAIHDGAGRVSDIAHGAADKLSATGEYVRDNDVSKMMKDVETLVKNNPGPALLAAAVIGFLVARSFSSSSD